MSKFLKVMITLLVIAGFVAPVAMADDRVSLSGYYQLRGYATDNVYGTDACDPYDDDCNDSEQFFYQRLRVQTDIAVAEGVTVTFRGDLLEGSGDERNGNGMPVGDESDDNDFDLDKAFVTIDQAAYTLTLGTTGVEFGNYILLDRTSDLVAQVALKSIPLTLAYSKIEEGTLTESDDQDMYTAVFDAGFAQFFAGFVNTQGSDDERMALGVTGSYDLDAVKLSYEIDYIDGETAGTDDKGLNFWLNGSVGVSEAVSVGAVFTYAPGEDSDNQVVDLAANDFSPENDGFMATTYGVFGLGDTFDPSGEGAGVVGIQPYVDFKISDSLAAHAHVGYAMTEDDDIADFEATTLAASMRYQYAANTTIDVAASYTDVDSDDTFEDDAATTFACRLNVNF
ncbi:hypothetical protein SAMN02745165_01490 [Malonomonas rubra DSM 5091]|uniref:Porin n=1 Tax=Malonomonas rubra DSM 5091 TaxID=1122189 RepID=A0A1M6GC49_MALRU|nr:hypothetical protein [Malonomonas rubra]SHJ07494.1 hypothetical protein SAMN02745165_01490 [Malonomonas rubra DSM 5091]